MGFKHLNMPQNKGYIPDFVVFENLDKRIFFVFNTVLINSCKAIATWVMADALVADKVISIRGQLAQGYRASAQYNNRF